MSNDTDAFTDVTTELSETVDKQKEIFKYETDNKYEDIERRKEELRINESINLDSMDPEYIKKAQEDSTDYLMGARESKVFINNSFKGKIPYFNKNLILLAAQTGQGKSTISANLAYHALFQGQKILTITNEENTSDVYNRVSCLCRGWSYTDHENFSDEQIKFFHDNIKSLSQRMMVIDDNYNGGIGQTTTIEGIEAIFNSILKNHKKYGVIIIDYYQNIDRSTRNPGLVDWQVQGMFVKLIDKIKNIIGCPIVLLAQKKLAKEGEGLSYKELVEGRKTISNAATCVAEITVDKSMLKTCFTIKKSRFADSIGDVIEVGFNKGKYVEWTPEFRNQALIRRDRKNHNEMIGKIKVSN